MSVVSSAPTTNVEPSRAVWALECEMLLARSRMHLAQARLKMERERRLELEEQLRVERARRRRGLFGGLR